MDKNIKYQNIVVMSLVVTYCYAFFLNFVPPKMISKRCERGRRVRRE